MFKRYECGCIGFVTNGMGPGPKRVTCIKACAIGLDSDQVSIRRQDHLALKASTKLNDDEIEVLFVELAALVDDGNALRELRVAMKVAKV